MGTARTRTRSRAAGAVTLRMTWEGEEPIIGDYLATKNGRTQYLILEMIRPTKPASYTFKAICERQTRRPGLLGVVWEFHWNKR